MVKNQPRSKVTGRFVKEKKPDPIDEQAVRERVKFIKQTVKTLKKMQKKKTQ